MGLCVSCASVHDDHVQDTKLVDRKSYFNNNAILSLEQDSATESEGDNVNGKVRAAGVAVAELILSVYSQHGSKGLNQDAAIVHKGYGAEKDGLYVGVYDGHGMNGHIVSSLVRDRLSHLLLNQKSAVSSQMEDDDHLVTSEDSQNEGIRSDLEWQSDFTSAFKAMDKEIKLLQDVDSSVSGSTAVVVVKQGDDLWIANLGDSRAMMVSQTDNGMETTQLTIDMKPSIPEEADRIRNLNGRVFARNDVQRVWMPEQDYPGLAMTRDVQRVWMPEEDYPGLAMTRAFGDFDIKKYGVVSIPNVTHHKLTSRDHFLVLATDGIWDMMSNDEVATTVLGSKRQKEAAKRVVDKARLAWKRRFLSTKVDDCTVACLFFHTSSS